MHETYKECRRRWVGCHRPAEPPPHRGVRVTARNPREAGTPARRPRDSAHAATCRRPPADGGQLGRLRYAVGPARRARVGLVLLLTAPGQGAQRPGFLAPWLEVAGVAEVLDRCSQAAGVDL